jgi:glucose/arabinose dehydrogenase
VVVVALLTLPAALALAASPVVTKVLEPAEGGAPVNPADVHMEAVFEDADGDGHECSDWEIWTVSPEGPVWEAHCATGAEKIHVHLGDGSFVNSYAGRSALEHDTEYELRVRFRDDSDADDEWSDWEERRFRTTVAGPQGNEATAWTARPGYVVEEFAEDLQLPVNIAMVPDPGPHAGDPLMYVTELYGTVKVVTRDGTAHDYETGLLNFDPTGDFPGSGEMGVTGSVVDPASGDVLVSLVYEDEGSGDHYAKVVRLESDERGLSAIGAVDVLDMKGDPQGASHQVSNLTISPAGELYVHNGDGGGGRDKAPLVESYLGKVLRMTLDGEPLEGNPFHTDDGEDTAEDYVWAKGFRNPFGGAWRLADETHYTVENGPVTDRLARVVGGEDYGWPGDETMSHRAAYRWAPSHAPVNIDFVEPAKFGGSGFPAASMGHAFVTESGPTYATGPQANGKRIVEFGLDEGGSLTVGPITLAEYGGVGKATAVGLAAGPDGLYFTDLYKDTGSASPVDRGANVLRVRYCGAACPTEVVPTPAAAPIDRAPVVRHFRAKRKVFAVGPPFRRKARSSAAKRGTAFLYSLSERATVRIQIRTLRRGWQVRGMCRFVSKRVRRSQPRLRRCVLRRSRGNLRASGRRGQNRRPYAGRAGRRWLRPGIYLATVRARDTQGNRAKPRTVRFRVVRSR